MARTSLPSFRAFAGALGVRLDGWQERTARLMLAKRADGLWAARNVGLSIPRQTGKTFLVSLIAIHRCALVPGLRAVWTAQHFSVIRDTFEAIAGLCTVPRMAGLVDPVKGVRRGTGSEAIVFRNGSRIMFRARERGAIRGFRNVGLLVADEAQIMSEGAMATMIPTQNRAANPQTLMMGTPPGPLDPGEVFTRLRARALAGQGKRTLWVEWAAGPKADPASPESWAAANPSYPERTRREAMEQMLDDLSPDDFRREALGIWGEQAGRAALRASAWKACEVEGPQDTGRGRIGFGLDMGPDRSVLSIGACLLRDDGSEHIELAVQKPVATNGVQWAVDWIVRRWARTDAVVVDRQSAAAVLIDPLKKAGVIVQTTGAQDMCDAAEGLLDRISRGKLTHLPDAVQPQLADAVRNATLRPIGREGRVAFNRVGTDGDISPLVACSLAAWGLSKSTRFTHEKTIVI